ncbi:hypothetical protein BGX31_005870 [Mortierella sp. GBA43]|nr:hypothetical protein BGX31_005870 [Mortierella sp. GBA43]
MVSPLPTPTKADSQVLSQAVKSTGSSFQVLYFALHGRGQLIRDILAYSGAKWEDLAPEWPAHKEHTPFGVVPVVYETTTNGTILELAESQAIERYLGRKFNLYGANDYEYQKVEEFFVSSDAIHLTYSTKLIPAPADKRVEEFNKFYTDIVAKFAKLHEAHLAKNGSNGHYVGNSTTLADVKTAYTIDKLLSFKVKGSEELPISAEKTPNLWKVYETVNSHPSLAEWKKSQKYQEYTVATKGFFKFE